MKRKYSKEPDLYVMNKKPSEKEIQELRDFIEEYKRKKVLRKRAKTVTSKKKAKRKKAA